MNDHTVQIAEELLKRGFIIEIRYLDYDPTKPHVYAVKIKEYDPVQRTVAMVSSGVSSVGVDDAYQMAYERFERLYGNSRREPHER
jgi:hypothetical protein